MRTLTALRGAARSIRLLSLLLVAHCSTGSADAGRERKAGDSAGGALARAAESAADEPAPSDAPLHKPEIGGNVAAIGDFEVELAIHVNGSVRGRVFDAQGKRLSDRDEVE